MAMKNTLRRIRRRRHLSQRELSELCGVSQQLLSFVERGGRRPSAQLRKRLARIFGVGVRELFPC